MAKEVIVPEDVVKARGFSQAIKVGKTIFISGQTATDEQGNLIGIGDIIAQTDRTYENLGRILRAAGASISDIVMLNIFCRDLDGFTKTGEARKKHFGKHFPASTAVQIDRLLSPDALIEVEAVAVVD